MREILFRGKDISGKWHYGVPLMFNEDYVCIAKLNEHNKTVEYKTLGQYTGLTDKNGTKIFEGDIVDVAYDIGYVGISAERIGAFIVVFENGCFMKRNEKGLFHFIPSDKCKVIGNIHDNPELLEVKE